MNVLPTLDLSQELYQFEFSSSEELLWVSGHSYQTKESIPSESQQCKSRELSQIQSSVSQLCNIYHDNSMTLYIPGACYPRSVSDHNGGK